MAIKLSKEELERIKNADLNKIKHLSMYQIVKRWRNRILEKYKI